MKGSNSITLLFAALTLMLGFLIGRGFDSSEPTVGDAATGGASLGTSWTCSMHPQVRLPEPGPCPICFMDLIPVTSSTSGLRALEISETAMALAEIETAPVERRAVEHQVPMVGKVAFDETRVAHITARVGGRLDRLFVDYTGVKVRKGDHMVEIYSPELFVAQRELLQSIETGKRMGESSLEIMRESSTRTVESAKERLRLFGLTQEQIDEIVARGTPDEHVTLLAPSGGIVVDKHAIKGMYVDEGTLIYTIADLSKVWILLEAYESDIAWIRYGQDVEFEVRAYPGEVFHGRVAFIDPVLDDTSRTVKVRLNVENPDGRFKPDMFVSAVSRAVLTPHGRVLDELVAGKYMCPMHPEVLADSPEACRECGMDLVPTAELGFIAADEDPELPLVVPATAPLITGKRAVVYLRVPGTEHPTFEGREVKLGPRAGDWYVVHEGLEFGDQVVVKGNFKLDSELQIRAGPSMMNPPDEQAQGEPEDLERFASPPAFREGLGVLLEAYDALGNALAADDDELAQGAARELVAAVEAFDGSGLEGRAAEHWLELEQALSAAAESARDARDIGTRRLSLSALTAELTRTLEHFGYSHVSGPAQVFHCPMAFDGAGGDWLQLSDETANPYYGAAMLRCGTSERELAMEP